LTKLTFVAFGGEIGTTLAFHAAMNQFDKALRKTTHAMVRAVVLVGVALVGCGGESQTRQPPLRIPVPQVSLLDTHSAAVGDEVLFHGSGFIDRNKGWTELTFRGVFRRSGGAEEPVNVTYEVATVDDDTLKWRFGPYKVPFSRTGDETGVFEGEVFATNFSHSGLERRQEALPLALTFEVKPSLVVREIVATGNGWQSDCLHMTTKFINQVPYRISFQAIGFTPTVFHYTISEGLLGEAGPIEEPVSVEHEATGHIDSLGDVEEIRFAPVPMAAPVYRASISVAALDEEGEPYHQFLMLTVHQPLQVRYRSGSELAELMEPEHTSGCMLGGIQGRDVSYSEQDGDTRTVSASSSLNSGWADTYTEGHTGTYGETGSESNALDWSSSDQTNWNWQVNGGIEVQTGIDVGAETKVTVKGGFSRDWGGHHSNTAGGQRGWENSTSYSEATSRTQALQKTHGESWTEGWSVSSTHSESLNFRAFLLPKHSGVFYRQTVRLLQRADVVAMDLCGNETIVGESVVSDYTWAPDLAMSTSCNPFPEPALPAAECFIAPCDEAH
jgi:hypothetical protein